MMFRTILVAACVATAHAVAVFVPGIASPARAEPATAATQPTAPAEKTAETPATATDKPDSTPSAQPAAEPNKPESTPSQQPAAAPGSNDNNKAASPPEQPPAADTAAAPASPPADPIIVSARQKLTEPARKKTNNDEDIAALAAFYAERTGAPLWVTAAGFSDKAEAAIGEISRAESWGLSAAAFDLPQISDSQSSPEDLAEAEVKLGLAVLKYARHARGGRINPATISALIDQKPPLADPKSVVSEVMAADAPDAYLRSLHPKHEQFERLRQALIKARAPEAKEQKPAEPPPIKLPPTGLIKPGAEHADIALLRQRLKVSAEAGKESIYDKTLEEAVKTFQRENGLRADGLVAARTRAALNGEPEPKGSGNDREIQRLLINMERWRWMPADLGTFHVWDNVPEYVTRVIKDGKQIFTEKIIVGLTTWPTPVFSADMKLIVFHPEWGVPDGIKQKELWPRLRQYSGGNFFGFFGGGGYGASSLLRAYNLRVSYNGRPVDPDQVNWSSVNIRAFSFVQPAGGKNPLGSVKFMFPNRHDVYMHDTVERHLFAQSTRALSHGCIRVQNPRRFAEILLAEDKGWSAEKVADQFAGGYTNEVKLDRSFPVHVTYFTAVAGDDGKVETFPDIYGQDSRVAAALLGRPMRFETSRGEPVADIERRSRRQAKQGGGSPATTLSDVISGLLAN